MHALTDLFSYKLNHFTQSIFEDDNGVVRIQIVEWSFEELFAQFFYPIWEYGKKDLFIQDAMLKMVEQLKQSDTSGEHAPLFTIFYNAINIQIAKNEFHKVK